MLTSMCIQWIQMAAMNGNNAVPVYKPEFLSPSGIARIPVPMLPLMRWMRVSQLLYESSIDITD